MEEIYYILLYYLYAVSHFNIMAYPMAYTMAYPIFCPYPVFPQVTEARPFTVPCGTAKL